MMSFSGKGCGCGIDPSLLGPLVSSFTSSSSPSKFKFPSIAPRTAQFGRKPSKAKAAAADCSSFPSLKAPSSEIARCGSSSIGRRELLYMSAVPVLVKDVGAVANAAEIILVYHAQSLPGLDIRVLQAVAMNWMLTCIYLNHRAYSRDKQEKWDFLHEGRDPEGIIQGKAAGVLRLVFHDAGTFDINDKTGGMNGSIVLELGRPENKGLKKSLKILEKAKSQIDIIRPVSWADMMAVAGAEAVSLCGGPKILVQLGRIDSLAPDPEGRLPEESLDAPALKQCFRNKGFSTQELVALSGAHTIGSKGFGDPFVFDNSYFKILLEKPWLSSAGMSAMIGLPSDRALVDDDECKRWIMKYADNQNLFFEDFKNAYVKLVNSGARWTNI